MCRLVACLVSITSSGCSKGLAKRKFCWFNRLIAYLLPVKIVKNWGILSFHSAIVIVFGFSTFKFGLSSSRLPCQVTTILWHPAIACLILLFLSNWSTFHTERPVNSASNLHTSSISQRQRRRNLPYRVDTFLVLPCSPRNPWSAHWKTWTIKHAIGTPSGTTHLDDIHSCTNV